MAYEQREPPQHNIFGIGNSGGDAGKSRLRYRLPRHLPRRPNDIYLDINSDFKAEQERGVSLLNKEGWVVVHGLGECLPQAITLALSLQSAVVSLTTLHTNTSTVFLTGDIGGFISPILRQFSVDTTPCLLLAKMFFSLRELTVWLGVTVLEVFIWLTALLVTLVLVVLHVENVISHVSWWLVLGPMFVADALNTYFCVIVLIRMYQVADLKPAALRALWSFSVLTLGFTFKFLLCRKLSNQGHLEYSAVMSPVFVLLQLILIRACHLNWQPRAYFLLMMSIQ